MQLSLQISVSVSFPSSNLSHPFQHAQIPSRSPRLAEENDDSTSPFSHHLSRVVEEDAVPANPVEPVALDPSDGTEHPLPWLQSSTTVEAPPRPHQTRLNHDSPPAAPVALAPVAAPAPTAPLLKATSTASLEGPVRPTQTAILIQLDAEGIPVDPEIRFHKRWEGWQTTTSTLYVTDTDEVPTAVTIYTTFGESPSAVDGGTLTITEYRGADTVTVLGPSYLTITLYPTTTSYSKTTVTVHTATKTKTEPPQQPPSTATICLPGDASVKEQTGLIPTHDQSITLYIVGIAIGWNLAFIRDLLFPFKMLTVAIHEAGHLLMCICFSVRVAAIDIDPAQGGQTIPKDLDVLPIAVLPMGYLFSIFVGGLLTFCGFDTLASKIASFLVGFAWLLVLVMGAGAPTKVLTVAALGLMVGLWWADHAWGLRFYILFVGVMNSFYVIWDVMDDIFFSKKNGCCPTLFARALDMPNQVMIFTLAWFFLSLLFFIGFVLAGLATWKESPHAMYCQAQTFLPT